MARLVFGMNQSVDGYVDHMVFAPSPTLFRRFGRKRNERASPFAEPRSGGGRPAGALQEQGGAPDAASEGLRSAKPPLCARLRHRAGIRGFPSACLRCFVAQGQASRSPLLPWSTPWPSSPSVGRRSTWLFR